MWLLGRWRCLGESLLATYQHLTTSEPPRPSLGKRVDLLEYRDLERHLEVLATTSAPVSVIQPTPVSTSPLVSVAEQPLLAYTPVTPTFPSPNVLESINTAGEPKGCCLPCSCQGFSGPWRWLSCRRAHDKAELALWPGQCSGLDKPRGTGKSPRRAREQEPGKDTHRLAASAAPGLLEAIWSGCRSGRPPLEGQRGCSS